jgi:hypothetical protein
MNGEGFSNPIVGGGGNLVYPSIHSPNFVAGASGWTIRRDGSAEFNNLTVRGTFNGTDYEINADGLFFYSGTPALGNLAASATNGLGSGFDSHGNAYVEGFACYLQTTLAAGLSLAGSLQLYKATVPGNPAAGWDATGTISDDGSGNMLIQALTGKLVQFLGSLAAFNIKNSAAPGAVVGASVFYSGSGVPRAINGSGFDGALETTQADTGNHTVTGTGAAQLSGEFTIPANDADAGTCYRLRCSGTGSQAAGTAVGLTLIESLAGTNINQVLFTGAGGVLSAGDPFDWEVTLEIHVESTGAGGTATAMLSATINKNNAGVTSTNNGHGVRDATGVAFDTTSDRTFRLNASWASTTGSPTITGHRTTFERIGP